jgi:hypothetical protein
MSSTFTLYEGWFRVLVLVQGEAALTAGRKNSEQVTDCSVNFLSNSPLTVILTFE